MDVVQRLPAAPPDRVVPHRGDARTAMRELVDGYMDGAVVLNPGGLIRYANPAARKLLRRSARQLVGSPFGIPLVPNERTLIEIPRPTGRTRQVVLRVQEIEWDHEPAFLALLRDVTRQRRLRRKLRRMTRDQAAWERRSDRFLAVLAHELRNPLAPLLSALETLDQGAHPDDHERARGLVERQARTVARLVEDLMDLSRSRHGRLRLRRQVLDLGRVLERAVEASRPDVDAAGLRLTYRPADGPAWVDADPTWLEVVVVHLVQNAAKYTDRGGSIELSAELAGDEALIRVRDDGVGIAPEILPRVFELFTQAERVLDRARGGMGIGLSIVQSIAGLHGGRVEADSPGVGLGSTFTVRLPAAAPPLPAAGPDAADLLPIDPRRVLIVDDHPGAAASLVGMLAVWGHEARAALDGWHGLDLVRTFRPDLVLLDIELPGLDGVEVARRIQQLGGRRPAVVALTGFSSLDHTGGADAFDGHLTKPVDLAALRDWLARPRRP